MQVPQQETSRKLIPDFSTWSQYFVLLTAVNASHQPALVPDLMAYMSEIAKYAKRFYWPSWVINDQDFQQEIATRPGLKCTRAEPAIFTTCFLTTAKTSVEPWCKCCHSVDHASDVCREAPRKVPRPQMSIATQICCNFNSVKGCTFYMYKYLHKCSICKGAHPKTQCTAGG